jgi:hypothetical protein
MGMARAASLSASVAAFSSRKPARASARAAQQLRNRGSMSVAEKRAMGGVCRPRMRSKRTVDCARYAISGGPSHLRRGRKQKILKHRPQQRRGRDALRLGIENAQADRPSRSSDSPSVAACHRPLGSAAVGAMRLSAAARPSSHRSKTAGSTAARRRPERDSPRLREPGRAPVSAAWNSSARSMAARSTGAPRRWKSRPAASTISRPCAAKTFA